MTNSLDPHGDEYFKRARVIFAYGLIGVIVGLVGTIDNTQLQSSSIAQLPHPLLEIVLLVYALGGALSAYGVLSRRPAFEASGIILLIGFSLVNAGIILVNRGPIGGGVTATTQILVTYVLWGRISDLEHAKMILQQR